MTGTCIALAGGLMPLTVVGQLVSIGTLLAFIIVSGSVVAMRRLRPEIARPFRTPVIWFVGPLGMIVCLAQMVGLPASTWVRLFVWMAIGLAIYLGYSRRRSLLRAGASETAARQNTERNLGDGTQTGIDER